MSKGLFWVFFLGFCTTSVLAEKPDVPQPVSGEDQRIERMFGLVNRIRAERRIPILGLDASLCHSAAVHAEEMARYNYVSDRGPGVFPLRSSPGSRASASGYRWYTIAEAVCAGSPDAVSVLNTWLRSRTHVHILFDAQYYDAGIGVAQGATRTYWVLVLATRPPNIRVRVGD
jgi:uncharacterized protein YkwD